MPTLQLCQSASRAYTPANRAAYTVVQPSNRRQEPIPFRTREVEITQPAHVPLPLLITDKAHPATRSPTARPKRQPSPPYNAPGAVAARTSLCPLHPTSSICTAHPLSPHTRSSAKAPMDAFAHPYAYTYPLPRACGRVHKPKPRLHHSPLAGLLTRWNHRHADKQFAAEYGTPPSSSSEVCATRECATAAD